MSQFSLSTTTSHFSTLLLSDFLLFCSFILTHPLYFSYFIFFSPYLLKLSSFLSPLFLTTSLLLLTLLTISPGLVDNDSSPQDSESKLGFFLTSYHTILNTLRSRLDDETLDEFPLFEEFEAFVLVFEASSFIVDEDRNEESYLQATYTRDVQCLDDQDIVDVSKDLACNVEDKRVEFTQKKSEENSLEVLTYTIEEKQAVESKGTDFNKVEEKKREALICTRFEEPTKLSSDNGGEYTISDDTENQKMLMSSNLGTCGSMRKEKEWKRTLACKLYEERKNVDGGEGMDLLWETYEVDSSKMKANNKEKIKVKKSKNDQYNEDEDEEEEEMDVKLCCLQALRFSTGKMNLGMGRPSLVKISKALKGIGWLHHVSKHGKKGKN